ncbi:MAG: DUF4340 domain-containing protein [Pseudomonadota bacterium]|nr:DUF4340 domain-containing protein [Pseudomonadota bacterium]
MLATVLLVLVAIVVFAKKPEEDAGDPDAPAQRKLFSFEADTVESLTLVNASGTLSFAKADGAWKMTAPKEAAVEERRVTEIVDRLADLKVQEKGFDGALADFGLDDAARVTVTVGTGDGTSLTLYVGRDAPVGYRGYVAEKAEGPALLASSRVGELVKRTPDDFRAKEPWVVQTNSARRIRIEDGGRVVVLRKDDHGWWLGDEGPRASTEAVEEWVSRASLLRAESFLDGVDPASVGLAPPATIIVIEDEAGTHTLRLGTRDDAGVAAQTDAGLVRFGADGIDLVKVDGWLAEGLLPIRRAQLDVVDVTLGSKSARFTRADGGWTDANGAETPIADKLLAALEAAKADRTVEPVALTQEWGRITLSEGESRSEGLTIGQELPAGGRAAKDTAGGPAFRIPAEDLAALAAALP